MIKYLVSISKENKKIIALAIDLLSINLSIYISLILNDNNLNNNNQFIYLIIIIILINFFIISYFFNIYKSILRYINYKFVINLLITLCLTGVISIILIQIININLSNTLVYNKNVYITSLFISYFLMIGWRIIIKKIINKSLNKNLKKNYNKKIAIYGAGKSGRLIANLLENHDKIKCVCFIDDDEALQDRFIENLKILSFEKFKNKYLINNEPIEIWIVIKNISKTKINEIIKYKNSTCFVRIIKSFDNLLNNNISLSNIRDVEVNDILGRDQIPPFEYLIKKNTENKVILVTGAGGSIGSEIIRQLAINLPSIIIMLDHSEYFLFKIEKEINQLKINYKLDFKVISILGSILDKDKLTQIIKQWKPNIIYHTAAYKHVNLVEKNIIEGIKNNIFGTKNCLEAANTGCVENFVLISTDKAVNPSNIMGLTKRICELLVINIGQLNKKNNKKTKYSIVRFGNVFGSSGSVVTIFKEQISNGGPITITDRNATRFFMTIDEAAQLVIQAGSLTNDIELFILDMGEQISIYDLAIKMIKLSGNFVDEDNNSNGIKLIFTGLNNGEKLKEELFLENSEIIDTEHPRIKKILIINTEFSDFEQSVNDLEKQIEIGNICSTVKTMIKLVPEATINCNTP